MHPHLHRLRSSDFVRILVLRTIGNFLILASLFMIVKTFYQPVFEELRYFVDQTINKQYLVGDKNLSTVVQENTKEQPKGGLARLFNLQNVEVLVPTDPEFSIVIPKIGANAKVIPNVNAADENAYTSALKEGVAHTLGTAFPGEGGHIYLFAHSTDYVWNVGTYNAIFYLLYKLQIGDEINLYYKGQRHIYRVTGTKIVDPSQVEYLTRKTDKEFLTLQTCWPPGTTLKRLLVFAEPIQ